jgi:hypothetical protein
MAAQQVSCQESAVVGRNIRQASATQDEDPHVGIELRIALDTLA